MKKVKNRPFKAPRSVIPPQPGHRKDNSEWGKRIKRILAQIEEKE
jgi:hypothetical protein